MSDARDHNDVEGDDILERSLRSFGCQQLRGGYIPMASDVSVGCSKKPGPADGPPEGTQDSFPSLVARDRLPAYTPWFVVAICDRFQFTGDDPVAERNVIGIVLEVPNAVLGVGAGVIERAGDNLTGSVVAAHRVDRDRHPATVIESRAGGRRDRTVERGDHLRRRCRSRSA